MYRMPALKVLKKSVVQTQGNFAGGNTPNYTPNKNASWTNSGGQDVYRIIA